MREQTETIEQSMENRLVENDTPYSEVRTSRLINPQSGCGTCGSSGEVNDSNLNDVGTPSYVYAIGRVEARFQNLAAEKEFAQATGRTDAAGKTDQQTCQAPKP